MRKRLEWKWELLDERTARARIIGGWIINHITQDTENRILLSESSIFIPDRDHEWTIVEPFIEPEVVKKDMAKDYESSEFPTDY
jgi:hypothetical protein